MVTDLNVVYPESMIPPDRIWIPKWLKVDFWCSCNILEYVILPDWIWNPKWFIIGFLCSRNIFFQFNKCKTNSIETSSNYVIQIQFARSFAKDIRDVSLSGREKYGYKERTETGFDTRISCPTFAYTDVCNKLQGTSSLLRVVKIQNVQLHKRNWTGSGPHFHRPGAVFTADRPHPPRIGFIFSPRSQFRCFIYAPRANFRRFVRPGDTDVKFQLLRGRTSCHFPAEAFVGGKSLFEAKWSKCKRFSSQGCQFPGSDSTTGQTQINENVSLSA